MNTQTLDGRYIDREKLVKLLKDLFGAGSFQIKVRFILNKALRAQYRFILIIYRLLIIIIKFPRLGHLLR